MMLTEPGLPLEAENPGTLVQWICSKRLNEALKLAGGLDELFTCLGTKS